MAVTLVKNPKKNDIGNRLFVGTPTRGTVRIEWVLARYGQIIPCNWSMGHMLQAYDTFAPLGYGVADAQNLIVKQVVEGNWDWLLLIEDDTCPPPDTFIRFNEYIRDESVPIVSGLYYTKSLPPEPLVYRGRGTSYYDDFKLGDKVWADGVPTGCLLINGKILQLMWQESPEYLVSGTITRRVFDQPSGTWFDPESGGWASATGTSDLNWCTRVMEQNVIERAGWKSIGRKKYPFLVDTNIFCRHVNIDGEMFPPSNVIPNAK